MKLSQSTPPTIQSNPLLSQWFKVGVDGQLTVMTGKVELGQGVSTALVQIACDALGLAPGQLIMLAGHTDHSPDEGYTAGSLSIQYGGAALFWACSHLYSQLMEIAARKLDVAVNQLCGSAGIVTSTSTQQTITYKELVSELNLSCEITQRPERVRDAQQQVGKPLPRLDFESKFSGGAYIQDIVIPGMQHVRMLRGQHFDQTREAPPNAELQALEGVDRVFRSGNFLALIGAHEGKLVRALPKARKLLKFSEIDDRHPSHEPRLLLKSLPHTTNRVHENGSPKAVKNKHCASYSRPYLAHASIGPACALARFQDGHLTVWSHTQGPYQLKKQIAAALKLDSADVEVIHAHGAGCYGHNGADDVAFDAALIAMETGLPVRVQWMRDDELTVSPVGSAGLVSLSAGLDEQGQIGEWSMELWSHTHLSRPGWGDGINLLGAWEMDPPWPRPAPRDFPLPQGGADRNAIAIYDFPHQAIDYHFIAESPIRVSALRSLGSFLNLFAIESFMDELAEIAGIDPAEFRLRHLSDRRAVDVIKAAIDMSGWSSRDVGGTGSGLGIGFGRYKNSAAYCAIVAKVNVEEKIRVEQLWIAVDAGLVVNPDGLLNQIEGGAIQSLSWTLKESVTWSVEGITSLDWENYPILGFDEIPKIEVKIIERSEESCLGAGEVSAGPAAAAVANAVTHALGLRPRHLPLTPERLASQIEEEM